MVSWHAFIPVSCTRAMQPVHLAPLSSPSTMHRNRSTIAHHSCCSLETPSPPLTTVLHRRCPFSLCPRPPAPPLSAVIAWSSARIGAGKDAAPPPLLRAPHPLSCRLRARRCGAGGRPVISASSFMGILASRHLWSPHPKPSRCERMSQFSRKSASSTSRHRYSLCLLLRAVAGSRG